MTDKEVALTVLLGSFMFLMISEGVVIKRLSRDVATLQREVADQTRWNTKQDVNWENCVEGVRDWNNWLRLRKEGWGSAWFVKPPEEAP